MLYYMFKILNFTNMKYWSKLYEVLCKKNRIENQNLHWLSVKTSLEILAYLISTVHPSLQLNIMFIYGKC